MNQGNVPKQSISDSYNNPTTDNVNKTDKTLKAVLCKKKNCNNDVFKSNYCDEHFFIKLEKKKQQNDKCQEDYCIKKKHLSYAHCFKHYYCRVTDCKQPIKVKKRKLCNKHYNLEYYHNRRKPDTTYQTKRQKYSKSRPTVRGKHPKPFLT